ncbi:MAG: uracil-DNA glycosylase [Ruminococcaceae bacterium]|nr:uracil-DNA glycosylase [Oscillospiraceae bacterium]
MVNLGNGWDALLKEEFASDYYLKLRQFLKAEYLGSGHRIFPPMNDIFNALKATDYNDVKVVILGQDPYHGIGQAHGLCFSVCKGVVPPPSLVNIYKELQADLGITPPSHGCLTDWAKNGVLLLNAVLTVREGQAGSHRGRGWEQFTDKVIELLNKREKPMVFMLWGNYAKAKASLIDGSRHKILTAAHPSPLSAWNGFFGCRHFSAANEFLGENAVDWRIGE